MQGVGQLLSLLEQQFDMQPIIEKGHIIGLKSADGGSVTLEPGGQPELSVRRWPACMKLARKPRAFTPDARGHKPPRYRMLGVGFQPLWGRSDIS